MPRILIPGVVHALAALWLLLPHAAAEPVGESFTIGAYYAMPALEPKDHFSWDYAFMDMARIGCNRIVVSGNFWHDDWAAIRSWGMKGITSYGQLNNYPGPGKWKPEDCVANITETRDFQDGLVHNGEKLGDTIIGHIMTDEPECGNQGRGLSTDEQDYLRAWADMYHKIHKTRDVYVNHCDPP